MEARTKPCCKQSQTTLIGINISGINSCLFVLIQHEGGQGLIEENEIYSNTLAGVWITTGKYITFSFIL
jgi:hypothetical protein